MKHLRFSVVVLWLLAVVCLRADLFVTDYSGQNIHRFTDNGADLGVFATVSSGNPNGIAYGNDGNFYVGVEVAGGTQIERYNGISGAFIDVFVSQAASGISNPTQQLNFGPAGILYVTSIGNHTMQRYSSTGTPLGNFISGGPADVEPEDFAFRNGNLYMISYTSHENEVLRYNGTTGAFIDSFIASSPLVGSSGFDFLPNGDLLVTDINTNHLYRFSGVDGSYLGVFDSGISLSLPIQNMLGPDGLIYVSDLGGDIFRFNAAGNYVDTVVLSGVSGIGYFTFNTPVPEPSTCGLVLLAGLALARRWRKR